MPYNDSPGLTIDELSAALDLPIRTIRYYIAEGLIAGPSGRGKGALYRDDQLARLRLIRRLSDERLPLADIKQQLSGLAPDDISALLREEESRSSELQLAKWAPSPRDYIAALLRNARVAREEPGEPEAVPSPAAWFRRRHGIEELGAAFQVQESPRSAGERWEHRELAPGIVLQIRDDARHSYRDLIDRLLREAERPRPDHPP